MAEHTLPVPPVRFRLHWLSGILVVWVVGTLAYGWWTTQTIAVPDPTPYTQNPAGRFLSTIWQPDAPLAALTEPWRRFDVVWYLGMAQAGYAERAFTAFAPLYPLVVALVNALTFGLLADNLVLVGMIVSTVCGGLALLLVYRLALEQLGSRRSARQVILLLIAFPTAFYLLIPYAESLYLLLALIALRAGQQQRWWIAGVCAALAVLTRFHGAVLIVPLAWLAFATVRTTDPPQRVRTGLRTLPMLLGVPVGVAVLFGFVLWQTGSTPLQSMASGWGGSITWPQVAFLNWLNRLLNGPDQALALETGSLIMGAVVLCGLAVVQAVRGRLRPEYALYALATLGLSLAADYGPNTQPYGSVIRHLLIVFPCFIVLAGLLQSRYVFALVIGGALLWQALLILRFTHWIWVA